MRETTYVLIRINYNITIDYHYYRLLILHYYTDTDIYVRFFSCEKPFRDLFLTNVIQSES